MDTLAPRPFRIALMVAFAGSCIGLLVFLWIEFGGAVPFAARGYRITAEFPQATELGPQDDVEIAGVTVGHVLGTAPDPRTGLTRAVLEIDPADAPRPADTRAILRQKSLLGETYVELTPGDPAGPMLGDGARLPEAQVAPTVSLDEVLDTFSPAVRHDFAVWMEDGGAALTGRGEDFNDALAQLSPFAGNVGAVLAVLDRDRAATAGLLAHGATVFGALDAAPGQLRALVENADRVLASTGRRASDLRAAVRALPTFLGTARGAIASLNRFAGDTQPLLHTLNAAAPAFSTALVRLDAVAPQLRTVLGALGPLTRRSAAGVPALQRVLDGSVALLARATPYLGYVVPILDAVESDREGLAAAVANVAASTEATSQSLVSSRQAHYLRISAPVNPEALTAYTQRPSSNRSNPYMDPGGYARLSQGLQTFGSYLCTSQSLPTLGPDIAPALAQVLTSVYFTADPSGPPCSSQSPAGLTQSYPQLTPLP